MSPPPQGPRFSNPDRLIDDWYLRSNVPDLVVTGLRSSRSPPPDWDRGTGGYVGVGVRQGGARRCAGRGREAHGWGFIQTIDKEWKCTSQGKNKKFKTKIDHHNRDHATHQTGEQLRSLGGGGAREAGSSQVIRKAWLRGRKGQARGTKGGYKGESGGRRPWWINEMAE